MGRLMEFKSPKIHQVRPWHRAMARMVVAGARPGEIAEAYGYTPSQVTLIMGSPLFQAEVARLEAAAEELAVDVNADLKQMAVRAAEVLDRELEAEPQNRQERALQVQTAFGVLDRAGFGKKDNPIHLHKHEHLEVGKLSLEELYKDVIDIASGDEGD